MTAAMTASLLAACSTPQPPVSTQPIAVVAAGSLREALTEVAQAHEARTGQKLALSFARCAPHVFVRNQLCAITQAQFNLTPDRLLDALLDPAIRLGTSTPKADPAGDYAWALFRRADAVRPGALATLERKALQLTGGPASPKAPAGRGTYAWVMDQGQADVFLTYCTNAVVAQQEVPRLKIVAVPANLQVGADYGLTVRMGAHPAAQAFADALLAPPAQAIFARYGFGQP